MPPRLRLPERMRWLLVEGTANTNMTRRWRVRCVPGVRGIPTPIDDLRGLPVLQVACGSWHSVAIVIRPPLLGCGVVYSWGCGTTGQLGLGGVMSTPRPKPVSGETRQ